MNDKATILLPQYGRPQFFCKCGKEMWEEDSVFSLPIGCRTLEWLQMGLICSDCLLEEVQRDIGNHIWLRVGDEEDDERT